MQITLRSLVLAPVLMAAVAFTATSAMAESTVNVPFNFTASGKTLPAGSYKLKSNGDFVKLDGPSQSMTWLVRTGDPAPTDKRVILKFDQVGSQHVLRSIQYGHLTTSQLDKKATTVEDISVPNGGQGQ